MNLSDDVQKYDARAERLLFISQISVTALFLVQIVFDKQRNPSACYDLLLPVLADLALPSQLERWKTLSLFSQLFVRKQNLGSP